MRINSISTQANIARTNNINNKQKQANPSFGAGAAPGVFNQMATTGYKAVSEKGLFRKLATNLSKSDRTFTMLMIAESVLLSSFYMLNTLRNDKIDKKQKPQMLINDAMVLGVSAAGSWFLDDKVTNVFNKMADKYFAKPATQEFYKGLGREAADAAKAELMTTVESGKADDVAKKIGEHLKGLVGKEGNLKPFEISEEQLQGLQKKASSIVKKNVGNAEKAKSQLAGCLDDVYEAMAAKKEANKIIPGINKLKTLVVFGIIYRYLGPVVVTPLANKISSKFFDNKTKKEEKTEATPEKK